MKPVKLSIKFDGKNNHIKNGVMDAGKLGSALSSFTLLLQEFNEEYTEARGPNLSIQVKSNFRTGSFEVYLEMALGIWEEVKSFLNDDNTEAILTLIEIIGLVGGGVGGGWSLIKFMRWKKNLRIRMEESKAGKVKIIREDNETVEIPEVVWQAYNNPKIRKPLKTFAHEIPDGESVDLIYVKAETQKEKREGILSSDERDWFDYSSFEKKLESEDTRERWVEIVKLSFDENGKWTFTDGGSKFNAAIMDMNFLSRVRHNEEFRADDRLKVRIRERQYITEGRLKSEYYIEEVLEHQKPQQQTLPGLDKTK